jgi:hypothetical protein
MAFYGLLLCGFHSNCTQYVWKPVASNAADELNQVQHHPAYLSLTRMMDLFRKCGEALSQRTARFSNCAGLRKLSAECRRVGL